ncbi:MAG TPA: hypothetical protein DDZ51_29920 [Planctomycetaceae bacterium]|nr:hypothetical protein [Planctomycetaceae bacterium]
MNDRSKPDVSTSLENSVTSVLSTAAWLVCVVILVNICGIIGGVASLLDRLTQGEDYVPYIGVWTATLTFGFSSYASTFLLSPKERPAALFAWSVVMAVGVFCMGGVLSSLAAKR